ncbi:MAG: hypothetical protein H0V89_06555 [Deltaproteobacteria bacterium]|nr:hypothetical protein [Deltaproteobacteria bacterium]
MMTAPDYPLLALGSYETYQLAHIATYISERLARHRRSGRGREGRAERVEAVRDIAGAATALNNATGAMTPDADLPRPLDRETFDAARELLSAGPRSADVVSLTGAGRVGWAVVGHVPGVGAVGAQVTTKDVADALRTHFLTRPADELATWAVTADPQQVPTLPRQVDLAAFAEHLDPGNGDDRAVARNLRGHNRRTDAAIRGRFANVDLDAAPILSPPTAREARAEAPTAARPARLSPAAAGRPVRRAPVRSASRMRLHRPAAAPKVPNTSAGP